MSLDREVQKTHAAFAAALANVDVRSAAGKDSLPPCEESQNNSTEEWVSPAAGTSTAPGPISNIQTDAPFYSAPIAETKEFTDVADTTPVAERAEIRDRAPRAPVGARARGGTFLVEHEAAGREGELEASTGAEHPVVECEVRLAAEFDLEALEAGRARELPPFGAVVVPHV